MIQSVGSSLSKAFRQTKDAINDATLTELDLAFSRERAGQTDLLGSVDFAEGVAAFQEKRAVNKGAQHLPELDGYAFGHRAQSCSDDVLGFGDHALDHVFDSGDVVDQSLRNSLRQHSCRPLPRRRTDTHAPPTSTKPVTTAADASAFGASPSTRSTTTTPTMIMIWSRVQARWHCHAIEVGKVGNRRGEHRNAVVRRSPLPAECLRWKDDCASDGWNYSTCAPFNGGCPDVVFMVHDPVAVGVSYESGSGRYADSYDEGTNAIRARIGRARQNCWSPRTR